MRRKAQQHLWIRLGSRITIDALPFWSVEQEIAALESVFREATEPNLIEALCYRLIEAKALLRHEIVVARKSAGLDGAT